MVTSADKKRKLNVGFLGTGRRGELLRFFRQSGSFGSVVGADANFDVPSRTECDRFYLSPLSSDKAYPQFLNELCVTESLDIIVPLNDFETIALANNRQSLPEGCVALVSDNRLLMLATDKLATHRLVLGVGFKYPRVLVKDVSGLSDDGLRQNSRPLVVKPRYGSGSFGTFFANTPEEMDAAVILCQSGLRNSVLRGLLPGKNNSVIVQERIQGKEYGADLFFSSAGDYLGACVKEKVQMRAGETDRCVTVAVPTLIEDLGRHLEKFGARGNIDVDFIVDDMGHAYCLDINPRFGGGFPFSHLSGFPALDWLASSASKEGIFNDYRLGVSFGKQSYVSEI